MNIAIKYKYHATISRLKDTQQYEVPYNAALIPLRRGDKMVISGRCREGTGLEKKEGKEWGVQG